MDRLNFMIQLDNYDDADFLIARQLGVKYVFTWIPDDKINEKYIRGLIEQGKRMGVTLRYLNNYTLCKCRSLNLGFDDREIWLNRFLDFIRLLGSLGLGYTTVSWQPVGVLSSRPAEWRGCVTRQVMQKDMESRPLDFDRNYTRNEIWDNFRWTMEKTLPVAEKSGVKLMLHPNDPPLPAYGGVPSLIYNADCYRKIFSHFPSDHLVMQFCVGCWLEGGNEFGNVIDDLKEFLNAGKVANLHFRNVSSPLPHFIETFIDDGYMDMKRVINVLLEYNYTGTIMMDHSPKMTNVPKRSVEHAYAIGYMRGMADMSKR